MKIVDVEQRSPEWFELRKRRMTASHAQAISANGKGLTSYIREKMCDIYSISTTESFTNSAMEHGIEQEEVARTIYEFESGNGVIEVGFVVYNDYAGASPDGIVGNDGLVEIKCPTNKVYFNLLLDQKIDSKYLWQMQMQMLVCDRKWCDYVVYNPNFKNQIFIKRVERDEKMIDKLLVGLESGEKLIKEIEKEMK